MGAAVWRIKMELKKIIVSTPDLPCPPNSPPPHLELENYSERSCSKAWNERFLVRCSESDTSAWSANSWRLWQYPSRKPEKAFWARCSVLPWKARALQPSSALDPCSPCSGFLVQATGGCTAPEDLSSKPLKAMIPRRSALAPRTYHPPTMLYDSWSQLEAVFAVPRRRTAQLLRVKLCESGN